MLLKCKLCFILCVLYTWSNGYGFSSAYRPQIIKHQLANYFQSRKPFPYMTPPVPRPMLLREKPRSFYRNPPYLEQLPFNPNQKFYIPIPVGNQNNLRVIPEVIAKVESMNTQTPESTNEFKIEKKKRRDPEKYEVIEEEGHGDGGENHSRHEANKEDEHAEKYKKKHGSQHDEEYHKTKGDKGEKKYDSEHNHSKGKKQSHFEEDDSGHYSEDKGSKKKHSDSADKHGSHHEEKKTHKGGKMGEKKHHKKGQKTSGYHNVFHKDEYKKDHTFYDTADHKGNFHKYGSDHADHHKNSGHHEKGDEQRAGHDEKHKQKKGHSEKGNYDKDDSGYDKKHGHDEHHQHEENYNKAKKHHEEEESAHKKGHKEGK